MKKYHKKYSLKRRDSNLINSNKFIRDKKYSNFAQNRKSKRGSIHSKDYGKLLENIFANQKFNKEIIFEKLEKEITKIDQKLYKKEKCDLNKFNLKENDD